MAMRYGVNIESITLFLFGGVSAMEEMPGNQDRKQRWLLPDP